MKKVQGPTYVRSFVMLIVSLALASPSGLPFEVALAQTSPTPAEAALERIDLMVNVLEELRSTLDRRQFDVAELALDFLLEEPDTIVDYVRDHIAFEQYPGLLRGPAATLMSRAGNTLDQAVLLANLLKEAGYDARVVLGRIGETDALALLDQMRHARSAALPFADFESMRDILAGAERDFAASDGALTGLLAAALQDARQDDPYGFSQSVQEHTDAIVVALDVAGLALGDDTWRETLVGEARDYAWVEYRLGPSSGWSRAHPAFHDPGFEPSELQTTRTFTETVPIELVHRLRVESVIDRRVGNTVTEHAIMTPWEVPVANLTGVPMTYWNMPDGYADAPDLLNVDAGAIADATNLFFPVLMGSVAEGALTFDLLGNVVAPEDAASPMAGIFRTVGQAASSAADALLGLGASPTERERGGLEVVAHHLRFTLVAPNGEETVYQRSLQAASGDKRATVRELATQRTFMVSTGTLSSGFVIDRLLQRAIASKPLLQFAVLGEIDPDATVSPDFGGIGPSSLAWPGHLLLYEAFDDKAAGAGTATLSYRHAPSLLLRHSDPLPSDNGLALEAIDVMANARRSFSWAGGALAASPAESLRRGVWDTHAEGIFFDPESPSTFSTMAALRDDNGEIKPLAVVTPERRAAVDDLANDDLTRTSMLRDLEAGYALVIPADTALAARTGWWRVDPLTGETLGIVSDGRGGALDYIVTLIETTVAVPVLVGAATTITCMAVSNRLQNKPKTISCTSLGVTVGRAFVGPTGWLAFGFVMGLLGIAGLEPADWL